MKQTLTLKLGQQLTMTPQLQQAIRLLQLSAMDLQAEIQEALETNPMLEAADDADAPDSGELNDVSTQSEQADGNDDPMQGDAELESFEPQVNEQIEQPIGEELPVDSSWEDVYPTNSGSAAPDSDYDAMANRTAELTLHDHLMWQLNLTPMADSDRVVASAQSVDRDALEGRESGGGRARPPDACGRDRRGGVRTRNPPPSPIRATTLECAARPSGRAPPDR